MKIALVSTFIQLQILRLYFDIMDVSSESLMMLRAPLFAHAKYLILISV